MLEHTSVLTRQRNRALRYHELLRRASHNGLKLGPRVLDYGAGYGDGTRALMKRFARVDAYEPYDVDWNHAGTLFTAESSIPNDYNTVLMVDVMDVLPLPERFDAVLRAFSHVAENGVLLTANRPWINCVERLSPAERHYEQGAVYYGKNRIFRKGYEPLGDIFELEWFLTEYGASIHMLYTERNPPANLVCAAAIKKGVTA